MDRVDSSMEKMHMAMGGIKPSGQTDIDFVRLMLPHHQAAIDMAKFSCDMARIRRCAGWRRRSSPTSNRRSS